VTLAIGYGGRQEVLDAIRALLYEQADGGGTLTGLAETLTTGDIARHLYTAWQPDPDLVIRTSGEQRVSNFLRWQTVHSELYFCDAYWPAFREIDFLRALRRPRREPLVAAHPRICTNPSQPRQRKRQLKSETRGLTVHTPAEVRCLP
jgi:undecaprenyl diphosphate synthase